MYDTWQKHLDWLIKSSNKADIDEIIEYFVADYRSFLKHLEVNECVKECISGYNRILRHGAWSSEQFDLDIAVGDICYIDFGHAYINEAGFQHFGLVMANFNYKILVVPMTSNRRSVASAFNLAEDGKSHLYGLGRIAGLNKDSVLFLNDVRFINSARVISVNAHMDVDSPQFKEISAALRRCVFQQTDVD